MKLRRALITPSCFAACLLLQACVEYIPENAAAPGSQPPGAAQVSDSPPAPPVPPSAPPPPQAQDSGLDALLAPIALYPDPLIALILPASTAPGDISAASAYLIQYGDPTRIDSQPWDPSVRALAHYPTVVEWMADNIAWTRALGAAFASTPADVMASIQRLRERAMVSGALAPSPQEQVVSEDGDIEIIPAQPDAICVPYYDPDSVFAEGPYAGPPIYFGPVFPAGIWLSYYVDWHHHALYNAGANAPRGPGGWYDPRKNGGRPPEGARPWHPPSSARQAAGAAPGTSAPRPRPMPGAATFPATRQNAPAPSGQERGEPRPQPAGGAPVSSRAQAPESLRGSAPAPHAEPARQQAPESHAEAAHQQAPAASPPADPRDRDQPH